MPSQASPLDQITLIGSLKAKKVPHKLAILPNLPDYRTYNIRLPYKPAIIVLPENEFHIQAAVLCASKHGIKVQAKSGGHSYASFSNGGVDGAMMIDLQNLQNIKLDTTLDIAKVGGGVRLGNLALGLYEQGKTAVSHGTCAGVGIGGHFTHGGYGFSSRAWGLAMDHIVGLDVVLADGSFVRANKDNNQDIYWGMRGAADSLGIVVNFYLETHQAPETVVNWHFDIPDVAKSLEGYILAFEHVQSFSQNSSIVDRNIGFGMNIGARGFCVSGTYFGTMEKFNAVIVPELLRGLPKPARTDIKETDWLTSLKMLNSGNSLNITNPYTERSNFFAKSVTVPEPGMSRQALESYLTYVLEKGANAPVHWFALVDLYGGVDSQINIKDEKFAAFQHRGDLWVAQHYGYIDDEANFPDEGIEFINGLNEAMVKGLPKYGAYENYVDPSLTRKEAHELYYGPTITERLKGIKEKIDPRNIFANPQSI
ncbi:uncharacterized protein BCR38DRAFT_462358 [Pseudomassariella vexata]|uniref:FAD-binding PCMH-type domain-containing protein n=1 Tax=Pseudomassariella vexata TaxID=1141098 RepID=A0A1Y2EI07_9PEZI|nr:uncharacterized protein BCR38DRAFT_462358 [Pseudomassariella vexata]ORY71077.1 hypothetical protein BCR38DRAFT_462358 [Pseudomassariella vexata]